MPTEDLPAGALPYKAFKVRHPKFNAEYWCRTKAFYKGGPSLLEDDVVMMKVFPRHQNEKSHVFELRKGLAHYINYAGEIVDHLVSKLIADPIRMEGETELDPFYDEFFENSSPPGALPRTFDKLLKNSFLSAMTCKTSWVLADMNPADQEALPGSLAEQEQAGMLNVWLNQLEPESVIDWEEDSSGMLIWALVMYASRRRMSLLEGRNMITEEYFLYTAEGWTKWVVTYPEDRPPKDNDIIPLDSVGFHSFGRVPLVRLDLPEGMWAMGKLESLSREHFNKRNALAWGEYKSLLPVLYEFLSPPDPLLAGPAADDNRAVVQTRSVAHIQERGEKDRAEWVAPDPGPFTHTLDSVNSLRDEMHRVVHQMALSADNKGAQLRRSAESKGKDEGALDVVLEALGEIGRDFAKEVMSLVSAGRGDMVEWSATGMSDFDSIKTETVLENEALLDTTVEIPSGTFKAIRKFNIAQKLLGDGVTEEQLDEVKTEIETFYAQDATMVEARDEAELRELEAPVEDGEDDGFTN